MKTLVGAVALYLAVCATMGPFHPDRSFVAYRYAQNVAAGHGFVYSPGQTPTEGFSSALWVCVCATLAKAGLPLPTAAPALALLFGAASLAVLWLGLHHRGSAGGAFAATAVAAAGGPLAVAAMSGEGITLAALFAVTIWTLLDRPGNRRRPWVLAALAGVLLAACGNPLFIVFPAALFMRARMRPTRGPADGAGPAIATVIYAAGLVALHGWRAATFGSLARDAAGFDGRASLAGLFVVQPHDMAAFGWLYFMLFALAVAGTAVSSRRASDRLALVIAAVLGAVTLPARDPLPGLAGSAAMTPVLAVPLASLVEVVAGAAREPRIRRALVAALLLVSLGWAGDMGVFARRLRETHRETLEPLGRWLARWRSDSTLLCGPPGAIPYYTGWNTALIARTPLVPASPPDVIVLPATGIKDVVADEEEMGIVVAIVDDYTVVAAVRHEWTRDQSLVVLKHRDVPPPDDELLDEFPRGIGPIVNVLRDRAEEEEAPVESE